MHPYALVLFKFELSEQLEVTVTAVECLELSFKIKLFWAIAQAITPFVFRHVIIIN